MTLAAAGLYLLLVGSLSLFLLIPLIQYRAAGRRKAERITADTSGLMFEDGARRVEAAWPEVTGYGIVPGLGALPVRYLVETRQGEFDFLASVKQATLLQVIVQRYATESPDREWKNRVNPEALGDEAARWSTGQVGIGARVYHYRTRIFRALLWLSLIPCLTLAFFAWIVTQGISLGGSVAGLLTGSGAFGALWLAGWYFYLTCRLETDAEKLILITPLGRKRLLWRQVEDYWLADDDNNGVVQGRGERIGFGWGIVGYEELKEEIARQATECGGKAWEKRTTTS